MTGAYPCAREARIGFSLMELLVVLGIIMIILGLSIGAVLRTPRTNALIGTEHMVSDVVRQARHTARSTGSPVVVELIQNDRQITGVTQLVTWSESFEGVPALSNWNSVWLDPIGATGHGLTFTGTIPLPTSPPYHTLRPQEGVVRPTRNNRIEGFYLACAVKPVSAAIGPDTEPLVIIGGTRESTSTCGLMLVQRNIHMQHVVPDPNPGPTPPPPVPIDAYFQVWEIIGWITTDTGARMEIGSIANSITLAPKPPSTTPIPPDWLDVSAKPSTDVAGPLIGERWEDIGLLYDGERLELYRNSQLVSGVYKWNAVTTTVDSPGEANIANLLHKDNNVYLGMFERDVTLPPGPSNKRMLSGSIDDVRLFRLGIDRAGTLPNGVSPTSNYRITIHPNGTVAMTDYPLGSAPVPTSDMIFSMPSSGAQETVTVSVTPDGVVTHTVNLPP